MSIQKQDASFAKLKEQARRILTKLMDEALRLQVSRNPRRGKVSITRDKITSSFRSNIDTP